MRANGAWLGYVAGRWSQSRWGSNGARLQEASHDSAGRGAVSDHIRGPARAAEVIVRTSVYR